MSPIIREYREEDLNGVLSAWESASKLAHPFLPEDFLEHERHNIPNLYLPNAETWVAEEDGRVIGFIALIGNEVGALFLDPEYHGRGVGRAMMDKARDLRGALEVEVFRKNSVGRAFYAGYGFSLMEEKFHEPTGNDLLRLRYAS